MVAVDLQEMAPIAGVRQLQGDITNQATAQAIIGCVHLLNYTDEKMYPAEDPGRPSLRESRAGGIAGRGCTAMGRCEGRQPV